MSTLVIRGRDISAPALVQFFKEKKETVTIKYMLNRWIVTFGRTVPEEEQERFKNEASKYYLNKSQQRPPETPESSGNNESPTDLRRDFPVLLCPKPLSGTGNYPWKDIPADLKTVPLTERVLETVANQFKIPRRFFEALREQRTHMPMPDLDANDPSTHSALFQSDVENYPGNIALVYTYFPGRHPDDINAVYDMLKRSGAAYTDPLLLPTVFAELQTLHLHELGEALMDQAFRVSAEADRLRSTVVRPQLPNLTNMVSGMNFAATILEENIAAAHRHIKRLINCIDPNDTKSMFRKRLEEMLCQYDDLAGRYRVNISGAIINAEAHATETSGRAAMAGLVLSFIAMAYLPISTVASIFAMPIFDFKADWLDIHGRPVPTGPSSSDTQSVIVSYYLTHYLGISFALSYLNIESWNIVIRGDSINPRRWWEYLFITQSTCLFLGVFWGLLKRSGEALKWLFWRKPEDLRDLDLPRHNTGVAEL
ncbi:hypothetical protein GQX73_g2362 [Xylaria multiplex]|uniref:Uncharacterized protein n=1 Tax=Xylaria multiplex TaxID=323545 RepID=A0A7C8IX13_9PEZI|nr:hypothetical protein GQX73_g2362 [Xylaria multiplex]